MHGTMSRADIQSRLGLKHLPHLRDAYLRPALASGWIEMTLPDTPRSNKQGYRLTDLGLRLQAAIKREQAKTAVADRG